MQWIEQFSVVDHEVKPSTSAKDYTLRVLAHSRKKVQAKLHNKKN